MEFLGVSLTEWTGYTASFWVMLSFFMRKIKVLRLVNMVGCVFWVVYGFMLSTAWPVIITNAVIFGVNFYYLALPKVRKELNTPS